MTDHPAAPRGDPDHLVVQVQGDGSEPERLLMISRPRQGRVRVREWTSAAWDGAPAERELSREDLYESLERAQRARRRISEELYRIRLWLDGVES